MTPVVGLDLSCLEATPETGVERYARRLAEHLPLVATDLEYVVFLRPGRPAPRVVDPARVVVVPSALPRPAWRETALPRAMRKAGVGVLHAPMAAIPFRSPAPRIATIFDLPAYGASGHDGRLSRNRLRLLHALRAARLIIVPSAATRDALTVLEPRVKSRLRVVPLGLDPDFRPEGLRLKRDRYGLPESATYLLWVGTLRQRKDPLTLVRAFGSLAEKWPELHLVMCGQLEVTEATLRGPVAGTPANDRLIITGYAAREDLPDLYRESLCLVLPSRLEGFGLPALEAMACGRPLVVSEDPALLELASGACSTFKTGDASDLAAALDNLLEDTDECERLAGEARIRARAFSWEQCATGHAAVYREALGGS
ncbi:MAG: hypothetical protein CMJ83_18045 [Planctomycetes bacterium]|nr:hypothetical protein [Planctomycetota bacterium]